MTEDSIALLRATLKGMGQETECDILVREQIRNQSSESLSTTEFVQYSECSVISAPADLPDGDYRVMFDGHFAKVKRELGVWLLREPVSRMRN